MNIVFQLIKDNTLCGGVIPRARKVLSIFTLSACQNIFATVRNNARNSTLLKILASSGSPCTNVFLNNRLSKPCVCGFMGSFRASSGAEISRTICLTSLMFKLLVGPETGEFIGGLRIWLILRYI